MATSSVNQSKDLTGSIAKHYNDLQEAGLEERTKSRIFYQRNFNNWIKSMAIADALGSINQQQRSKGGERTVTVLDLCSGKGGDLLKWRKGNIDRLVCADIADTSVKQCEERYKEMVERVKQERSPQKLFSAEFISADCTKARLKDMYKDPSIQFDLVSCQFSLHYGFESLSQAERMIQNACECLKPGGLFIGTIPNAYELVKRLHSAEGMEFGSEVYKISFEGSDKSSFPLFGAKYHFMLEGVVNCPEFLVYFPLLEKLVEKYNLKLVHRTSFADFFKEKIQSGDGRGLIGRMQGLEPYPPDSDVELMGQSPDSYSYVKDFYAESISRNSDQDRNPHQRQRTVKLGTLSQPEWEASTVYMVFVFQRANDDDALPSGEKFPPATESSELKRSKLS